MLTQLFIFIAALYAVIKGATLATTYAARLAERFRLSKYTVGFFIVAIISILPEGFIAVNSAIEGVPAFGLGTLLGSNIADLTLVFAIIILSTGRALKVESSILKNHIIYPFLLLLPILLGLDGYFSREEGLALILGGGAFYYFALRNGMEGSTTVTRKNGGYKNMIMLFVSMVMLLVGSHFTVTSATSLAQYFGVSSILIGLLIVGLGTTMPELFFSLKSAKKRDDSLAIGDVLGTVLADATVLVGVLALIRPFSFPQSIMYLTGIFMVAAALVLFWFMRTGRTLSRKEAWILLGFWVVFVLVEFFSAYAGNVH